MKSLELQLQVAEMFLNLFSRFMDSNEMLFPPFFGAHDGGTSVPLGGEANKLIANQNEHSPFAMQFFSMLEL